MLESTITYDEKVEGKNETMTIYKKKRRRATHKLNIELIPSSDSFVELNEDQIKRSA